ncbi:type II toxin-antitoxin system Phd/YefM family antitoxin [Lacimicrobium alkaliphilum]|uniref:Antitoxin n=1 Tax=Lacimicrobium alkaliphilum TaxID=1526571 RepID=A0ABQ1RPV9_9ALTE|nr:type II toxin-antitoxin system Phd/YefM family antitoxin [Lacimicrobium alkaliphilum]GGD73903.1 hypothetical protein GCM10011357_31180 [Lacimicrobium alkaliphilum]
MADLIRKGVAEFRRSLGTLLKGAGLEGERVVVTNHGKDIAALISIEELERFNQLETWFAQQEADGAPSPEGDDVGGDHNAMFAEEAPRDNTRGFDDLTTYDETAELQQVAWQIKQTRMQINEDITEMEAQLAAVIANKINTQEM